MIVRVVSTCDRERELAGIGCHGAEHLCWCCRRSAQHAKLTLLVNVARELSRMSVPLFA